MFTFWANFHHLVTPKKKRAENFTNVFIGGKIIIMAQSHHHTLREKNA
jgi:hypothetical protein